MKFKDFFIKDKNLQIKDWPVRDIIIGISGLLFFYILGLLKLFKYKPWISQPFYFYLGIVCILFILFYSLYLFRKHTFKLSPTRYTLKNIWKEFYTAFFLFIVIYIIAGVIINLISLFTKIELSEPCVWKWIGFAPNNIFVTIILIMGFTISPIAEELFFRGFLYNALKSKLQIITSLIIQCLIFAIYHQYNFMISLHLFLIGIGITLVYEIRKNIYSPIFIHMIGNGITIIIVLIPILNNFHSPSENFFQAQNSPSWLLNEPPIYIERQKDGLSQLEYTIDKWGSKGSKRWKKEANAFNTILKWFPNDKKACAKAQLGISSIYYMYLNDKYRAIINANKVIDTFPNQKYEVAKALIIKGWASYLIKDFQNSYLSFEQVTNNYSNFTNSYKSARKGLKWLKEIGQ